MGDNFEAVVLNFIAKSPIVGTILLFFGAILVLGKVIIEMTPNKEDDEWYGVIEKHPIIGRVIKFLSKFAPIQAKEKI